MTPHHFGDDFMMQGLRLDGPESPFSPRTTGRHNEVLTMLDAFEQAERESLCSRASSR